MTCAQLGRFFMAVLRLLAVVFVDQSGTSRLIGHLIHAWLVLDGLVRQEALTALALYCSSVMFHVHTTTCGVLSIRWSVDCCLSVVKFVRRY